VARGFPVYVVDDDESVLESVQFLLESFGIPSRLYPTPFAFLQELGSLEPGCLLTDLRMPSMSGLELHSAVRARELGWPVILMSAHFDGHGDAGASSENFLGHVEKPFTADRLFQVLDRAFAQLKVGEPGEEPRPS
jgi:two-component system response regulator FixJ